MQNSGKSYGRDSFVPDDIPKGLLDKAECVIVLLSVMKFAIGFGGVVASIPHPAEPAESAGAVTAEQSPGGGPSNSAAGKKRWFAIRFHRQHSRTIVPR